MSNSEIQISIEGEALKSLQEMSKDAGKSNESIVSDALGLYKWTIEHERQVVRQQEKHKTQRMFVASLLIVVIALLIYTWATGDSDYLEKFFIGAACGCGGYGIAIVNMDR